MKYLLGALLLLITGLGSLESQTLCRIATPSWPNLTNEDGTGYYFDILRNIYEPLGIKVEIHFVPWKRAVEMVTHSEADLMLGLFYNPENPEAPRWVKWPYDVEETVAVYKKTSVPLWEGQISMENKKVLWPRGYNYYKFLTVKTHWSETTDVITGLAMLALDRVDFFMCGKNGILTLPPEKALDKTIYDYRVVIKENLYPSFAPSSEAQKLARIYDQRIPILLQNGTIQNIYQNYGKSAPELFPRE